MIKFEQRFVFAAFIAMQVLAFMLFSPVRTVYADYDYINISNPFIRKIPIAVPEFVPMESDVQTGKLAVASGDEVSKALAFTGYFKLMDRASFLEQPKEKGIAAEDINFKNWSDIGAELLITGGISVKNGLLKMEMRLFDPFSGRLLMGKRYTGSLSKERDMALRFCSEVVFRLTGKKGVFNSRIAFVSAGPDGKGIFSCDFDGANVKQVIPASGINLFPAWSVDGRSLAYTSYKNGKPDIFVRNMEKQSENTISFKGINITPTWVPGSDKMAATLSFEGDEDIYLLTASGKVDKRLTSSWGVDVSPSFSPDGDRMAFVSNRSGSPQVYVMDMNTREVSRLTYKGNYNTQPDWSPAGKTIAYCGMEKGHTDIFMAEVKTGKISRLTHDAGNNESPSFSPDGSLVVFSSNRDGKRSLYVMTASGTDQRLLLDMPGEQSLPAWSPEIDHFN
ncbi:MAG: Tol-Pal system beta propeller repeat protein TolB [Deltaproteobacteria bacterium]|nr:Tol-Pal system beta propeller repeat protein TolB [Deltaproteobacteria bacterium]